MLPWQLDYLGAGGGGGGYHGNGAGSGDGTLPAGDLIGGKGGNGGNGFSGAGGGGGAGGYGAVLQVSGNVVTSNTYRGGNGGHGGLTEWETQAGGGGDGGIGLFFSTMGGSVTVTTLGQIIGGNGGNGGEATSPWGGAGAAGGNGGNAIEGNSLTVVNQGTIQGGNAGAGGTTVSPGGTNGADGLAGIGISGSDLSITNAGTITGGLNASGSGRANAITFTGGTNRLELRVGSAITGDVVVQSGTGTLAFGGATNSTFDAASLGPGGQYQGFTSVEKTGASTWTMTGTSFFAGPTTVEAGHLAVNGSLAYSDVRVTGGSLGGTGAVGGIVVESGGTVAPGTASIGRLNAARNVRFDLGSTYEVNVTPTHSDFLWANGTATLNGGTVKVLAESGSYQPSTTYTILMAEGGRTGTFTGVTSDFAYLDPSLSYTTKDVRLTLVRKIVPTDPTDPGDPDTPSNPDTPSKPHIPDQPAPVAFNSVAVTPNQFNVANAVEALGAGNSLFDAIIGQSAAGAQQGFDALSGEAYWYTSYLPEVIGQAMQQRLLEHMRPPLLTRDQVVNQPLDTYQPRTYTAAYSADRSGTAAQPVPITLPVRTAAPRYSLWGEGFGSWGSVDSNANAPGLDSSSGGFILGADTKLDPYSTVGLAGGFSRTTFDVDARLSSGSTDSIFAALYGSTSWGSLALRLGASYAWNDIDVSRTIRFPGFSDSTHASYGGYMALAFAELGYRVDLGVMQLEPFVGASLLRLHADGFQEEGGPAALTGYAQDQDLATTTLGLRAEARLSQDLPLTLRGVLGWRHTFGDVQPESLLAFAGGASPFTVQGNPLDRNALVAEAGLDWHASDAISLGIAYSGQVSERAQEHSVKGSFVWRFGTR